MSFDRYNTLPTELRAFVMRCHEADEWERAARHLADVAIRLHIPLASHSLWVIAQRAAEAGCFWTSLDEVAHFVRNDLTALAWALEGDAMTAAHNIGLDPRNGPDRFTKRDAEVATIVARVGLRRAA